MSVIGMTNYRIGPYRPASENTSTPQPRRTRIGLTGVRFLTGQSGFYRAMHFSAKRGIAIACRLSVRLSVCLSVCNVGEL